MWVHSYSSVMLAFSTSRLDTKRTKSAAGREPPRVWHRKVWYSCSPNKKKNQIIPWTSLDSWLSILYGKSGHKNVQLVLQHCYKTSWKAVLRVLPLTNQTCLATNQDVAGCKKLLQKVESSSTCLATSEVTSVYVVTPAQFYPIRSQYSHNLHQPDLLQDRFERRW